MWRSCCALLWALGSGSVRRTHRALCVCTSICVRRKEQAIEQRATTELNKMYAIAPLFILFIYLWWLFWFFFLVRSFHLVSFGRIEIETKIQIKNNLIFYEQALFVYFMIFVHWCWWYVTIEDLYYFSPMLKYTRVHNQKYSDFSIRSHGLRCGWIFA